MTLDVRGDLIPIDRSSDTYTLLFRTEDVDYHHVHGIVNAAVRFWDDGEILQAGAAADAALKLLPIQLASLYDEPSEPIRNIANNATRWRDLATAVKISCVVEAAPDTAAQLAEDYLAETGTRDERLWKAYTRALHRAGFTATLDSIIDGSRVGVPDPVIPIVRGELSLLQLNRKAAVKLTPHTEPKRAFEATDSTVSTLQSTVGSEGRGSFKLIIVSGMSAAGKDTVVHMARDRARGTDRFQILTKYTTRRARSNEPGYMKSISETDYDNLQERGGVLWPYEKRNVRYGFDAAQLRGAIESGRKTVAIFTELDEVPSVCREMRRLGHEVHAVFLNETIDTARERMIGRGFDAEEQLLRMDSVYDDFRRLGEMPNWRDDYIIVQHDNDRDVNSAVRLFMDVVRGDTPT